MSKRNIIKSVVWGVVDFAALPVVAALSFATGEHKKVMSVSEDLNDRLEEISACIKDARSGEPNDGVAVPVEDEDKEYEKDETTYD